MLYDAFCLSVITYHVHTMLSLKASVTNFVVKRLVGLDHCCIFFILSYLLYI